MAYDEGFLPLSDLELDRASVKLLEHFVEIQRKVHRIPNLMSTVRVKPIDTGLSATARLFLKSKHTFPFFIKIGSSSDIQVEYKKHNLAQRMLPAQHFAERVYFGSGNKINRTDPDLLGRSIVAFRYITAGRKDSSPEMLHDAYRHLSKTEMIEVVNDLFQVIFHDFHGFATDRCGPLEVDYLVRDEAHFKSSQIQTVIDMFRRYNDMVERAVRYPVPHGRVHGDLHLRNVLLGRRNTPVIIDFAMTRDRACLLTDFAEFEVALLLAALEAEFDEAVRSFQGCYISADIRVVEGATKLNSSIRELRAVLFDLIANSNGGGQSNREELSYVYSMFLLRYFCSYGLMAEKTLKAEKAFAVVEVMRRAFEAVLAAKESKKTNRRRRQ